METGEIINRAFDKAFSKPNIKQVSAGTLEEIMEGREKLKSDHKNKFVAQRKSQKQAVHDIE